MRGCNHETVNATIVGLPQNSRELKGSKLALANLLMAKCDCGNAKTFAAVVIPP